MRVGLVIARLVLLGLVAVFVPSGGGAVGGDAQQVLVDNPDYDEITLATGPKLNRAIDAGQDADRELRQTRAFAFAALRPILHACADGLARLPHKTRLRVVLTTISLTPVPKQDAGAVGRLVGTVRLEDIATRAIIGDLGIIDVERKAKHNLCATNGTTPFTSHVGDLSAQNRIRILSLAFIEQINTIIGGYF